jgi:hypothetical protein
MSVGRFNRPDPVGGSIGNPQSLNRYAYVQSDPINAVDPLGLFLIGPLEVLHEFHGIIWHSFYVGPGTGGGEEDSGRLGEGRVSGGVGDNDWGRPNIPNKLSDCLKNLLGEFFRVPKLFGSGPMNLDEITLHEGIPSIVEMFAPLPLWGFTLGSAIHFNTRADFTIIKLVHEMVHVEQFQRFRAGAQVTSMMSASPALGMAEADPAMAHALSIVGRFSKNVADGMDAAAAYRNLPTEKEARDKGDDIVAALESRNPGSNTLCGLKIR